MDSGQLDSGQPSQSSSQHPSRETMVSSSTLLRWPIGTPGIGPTCETGSVQRPRVLGWITAWFWFSATAWLLAALAFSIPIVAGFSGPVLASDHDIHVAGGVIGIVGAICGAALFGRCLWIVRHLPRRTRKVWEAVQGQAIIGCILLFPLGILINLPILLQWHKQETKDWFGVQ